MKEGEKACIRFGNLQFPTETDLQNHIKKAIANGRFKYDEGEITWEQYEAIQCRWTQRIAEGVSAGCFSLEAYWVLMDALRVCAEAPSWFYA